MKDKSGPKYCVVVLTVRAKKPQFFGFDGLKNANNFYKDALKNGCSACIYEIKKTPTTRQE